MCFYEAGPPGARPLRRVERGERAATRVAWNRYAVTGEVTFRGQSEWILDFGIPAVGVTGLSELATGGAFLSGRIELAAFTAGHWGEDLFEPPAPPIDFAWEVERIWRDTTPWTEVSPRVHERADVAPSFVEVEATDHASERSVAVYVLDCRLLSGPARGD